MDLKTSEEWNKYFRVKIIEPNGWDKQNFHHAWFEERITSERFLKRVKFSVVSIQPLRVGEVNVFNY